MRLLDNIQVGDNIINRKGNCFTIREIDREHPSSDRLYIKVYSDGEFFKYQADGMCLETPQKHTTIRLLDIVKVNKRQPIGVEAPINIGLLETLPQHNAVVEKISVSSAYDKLFK